MKLLLSLVATVMSVLTILAGLVIALAAGHVWANVGRTCAYIPTDPYIICWVKYSNLTRWEIVGLSAIILFSVLISFTLYYRVFHRD